MLGRIRALEDRVLKLEENSEKAAKAGLEALARLPGARGSVPPPKM